MPASVAVHCLVIERAHAEELLGLARAALGPATTTLGDTVACAKAGRHERVALACLELRDDARLRLGRDQERETRDALALCKSLSGGLDPLDLLVDLLCH